MDRSSDVNGRIVTRESVRNTNSILIDYNSVRKFLSPEFNSVNSLQEREQGRSLDLSLVHAMQALVLHDTLLIDSILFDLEATGEELYNAKDLEVKGLSLATNERAGITGWGGPSQEYRDLHVLSGLGSREITEHVLEINGAESEAWASAMQSHHELDSHLTHHANFGGALARIRFYLELSRHAELPLHLDPYRTNILETAVVRSKSLRPNTSIAETVVGFAKETMRPSKGDLLDQVTSSQIDIPPVSEYILADSIKHRCSLRESALSLRHSDNAVAFRKLIARMIALSNAHTNDFSELNGLKDEIREHCELWARDTKAEVVYRKRKLTFEKIPIVGNLLKTLGLHEGAIRDPILKTDVPQYLLFLNDLLRGPGL